jgi:hypothetical protein
MANFEMLCEDLRDRLYELPEETRHELKECIRDIFFAFRAHAGTLDKIFSDALLEKTRRTMMPHLQAIALDAMTSGLDLSELPNALETVFPEWKDVVVG